MIGAKVPIRKKILIKSIFYVDFFGGEGGTLPSLRHPKQNQLLMKRYYTERSGFV